MLIGRQLQLADLIALGSESTRGARVAWLVGEEGVGKSTLANEAASRSGVPVRRLDLYPEDRDSPLSAVGELAYLLGATIQGDPAQALLRALEEAGPLCLIIEDAQWMDEASQLAIWQVVRRFSRLPVWLLVTSLEAQGPLLDGLGLLLRSPDRGKVVTVRPLNEPEVSLFLKSEVGIPIEGDMLTRVHGVTGGYPGLLVSLIDQLRLGGRGASIRDALRALTDRSRGSGLLGHHVSSVLAAATPSERAALLALAQTGELTPEQLGQVLELRGLPDIGPHGLRDTGLVDRGPLGGLRMRHRISQREVRARVSWTEARASHAVLAEVLVGLDALEHRVTAVDDEGRPALLQELIARLIDAYAQHDLALAFRLVRYAARLDQALMVEVVLAALRSGRPTRLLDVSEEIANMPPCVTRTAALAIMDADQTGYQVSAERLLRIDVSQVVDSRELVAYAHAVSHICLQASLETTPEVGERFIGSIPILRAHAEALLAVQPDLAAELTIHALALEMLLEHALKESDPLHVRISRLEALRQRIEGDPQVALLASGATGLIGLLRWVGGELGLAHEDLQSPGVLDIPVLRMQTELALASIEFVNGDWDAAHSRADHQLALTLDALQSTLWPQAFAIAAYVPAARGEDTVTEQYLGWQHSSRIVTAADVHRRLALAWRAVSLGDREGELASLLDEVWESAQVSYTSSYPTAVLRVRGHLASGDRDAAIAARDDLAGEGFEAGASAYVAAHIEALLGDDPALFEEALALLRAQLDAQPEAGLRLYLPVLAEDWALRGAEDSPSLGGLLRESVELLNACGASAWRDRLSALETQLTGLTGPESLTGLLALLTSREREVARLVGSGMSNRDVANRLFVTVRTAEYHVHNALTKLGMTSRQQLRMAFAELD